MKTHLKRIVAILGATLLLVSQKGVIMVNATELPNKENEVTIEEASAQEEKSVQEERSEQKRIENEKTDTKHTIGEKIPSVEEKKTDEETSTKEKEEVTEEKAENAGIALLSMTEEDEAVKPATNLRWSDEILGKAVFYNPNEETVSFVLHLFKAGNEIGAWKTWNSENGDILIPCYRDIVESGTYTFKIETFAYGEEQDHDLSSGCISEESPVFNYVKPDSKIAAVKNISWSSNGVISWDAVDHADMYQIELYCADGNYESGYRQLEGRILNSTYTDFSNKLAIGYEYFVRVKAISENINLYTHSEYSDYIAFDGAGVTEKVNDKFDTAIGDSDLNTDEGVKAAVSSVKAAFDGAVKDELKVAMQTDAATQGRVQTLEAKYKDAMQLETSVNSNEDTGIDAAAVKLLGAALNATESGKVEFSMSKPSEDIQKELITTSRFKKAIVLNLELDGAGITKGAPLAVPVTVTMPAPQEIDINVLTILHYNDDGTYETLPVRANSDGTISFTVTHFSNFVFGEKESQNESGNPGISYNTDDGSSISNDGGKTVNSTLAMWQPTTPDEIKRYSVFGKEKVSYSVDTKNTYPVTVLNVMHGKLCFDSFEAALGDYTIGRTYNILPTDKAIYKMDSKAKITLDIPKTLLKNGREYKMICVTQNGQPIVLNDLDKKLDTITFETDSYYAFALVYKNAK